MPDNKDIGIINVERAVAALRSGGSVILVSGKNKLLVVAAESFPKKNAPKSRLLLTENRAKFLGNKIKSNVKLEVGNEVKPSEIKKLIGLSEEKIKSNLKFLKTDAMENTAIKLVKIAELIPAAIVSGVKENKKLAEISVGEINAYEKNISDKLEPICTSPLKLKHAPKASITVFRAKPGNKEHYAIIVGNPKPGTAPNVRIHSSCFTGDLLESLECDCGEQLHDALSFMSKNSGGILLYLMQEGRGIGLANKLRAYALKAEGMDTVEANEFLGFDDDERPYLPAAAMLKKLGFKKVKLITNNPRKVSGLEELGIKVEKRVALNIDPNEHNIGYLDTKRRKLGHHG